VPYALAIAARESPARTVYSVPVAGVAPGSGEPLGCSVAVEDGAGEGDPSDAEVVGETKGEAEPSELAEGSAFEVHAPRTRSAASRVGRTA
jgi:hypothetical protein